MQKCNVNHILLITLEQNRLPTAPLVFSPHLFASIGVALLFLFVKMGKHKRIKGRKRKNRRNMGKFYGTMNARQGTQEGGKDTGRNGTD